MSCENPQELFVTGTMPDAKIYRFLKQQKIAQLIHHSSCNWVNSRPAETMAFLFALGQVNDDDQGIDIFLQDMR